MDEYQKMYELEDYYWWFVARRKLCLQMIEEFVRSYEGRNKKMVILDAGCGTGAMLLELQKLGQVFGVDESPEAIEFCRRKGLVNLYNYNLTNLEGFPGERFDVIIALDVLEHIEDDISALKELHRVCAHGGGLIITVPAYGFLWSEHDEALDHKRRYAAPELRNKLHRAGFKIQKISYVITILFFPIFLFRFWQSLTKNSLRPSTKHIILPQFLNNLLICLLDLEKFVLKFMNLPFGVSIVCIARKT